MPNEHNPFHFSGPLSPEDMIDRRSEASALLALAEGGHSMRLLGPRRYGKTTLLAKVLADADDAGMATALVDLEDVLSLSGIVVRRRDHRPEAAPLRQSDLGELHQGFRDDRAQAGQEAPAPRLNRHVRSRAFIPTDPASRVPAVEMNARDLP